MSTQMSAHAKRLARAKRRAALVGPITYMARQVVIAAIKTLPADHRLRRWEDPLLRVWELPEKDKSDLLAAVDKLQGQIAAVLHDAGIQPGPLGEMAALLQTETEIARVGQARKAGRPAKPENSNDGIIALLRKHRPLDFVGRFGSRQAEDARLWLERRKIYKSADAITKMVNRAKRSK